MFEESIPVDKIALVTEYCWLFSGPYCQMVEDASVALEREFDAINGVLFPEAGARLSIARASLSFVAGD